MGVDSVDHFGPDATGCCALGGLWKGSPSSRVWRNRSYVQSQNPDVLQLSGRLLEGDHFVIVGRIGSVNQPIHKARLC